MARAQRQAGTAMSEPLTVELAEFRSEVRASAAQASREATKLAGAGDYRTALRGVLESWIANGYLRPFLETVTHVGVSPLSLMLLVIGAARFVGTVLVGAFLKNGHYRTLVVIPVLMAAIAMALVTFGGSVAVTTILLGIWGLVATAAPVAWWTWLARTLPDDAEAGGGLIYSVHTESTSRIKRPARI